MTRTHDSQTVRQRKSALAVLPVQSGGAQSGELGKTLHWTGGRKWIVEQDSCLSLSVVETDAHTRIWRNTHTQQKCWVTICECWISWPELSWQAVQTKCPICSLMAWTKRMRSAVESFSSSFVFFFLHLWTSSSFLSLSFNSLQIASTFCSFWLLSVLLKSSSFLSPDRRFDHGLPCAYPATTFSPTPSLRISRNPFYCLQAQKRAERLNHNSSNT